MVDLATLFFAAALFSSDSPPEKYVGPSKQCVIWYALASRLSMCGSSLCIYERRDEFKRRSSIDQTCRSTHRDSSEDQHSQEISCSPSRCMHAASRRFGPLNQRSGVSEDDRFCLRQLNGTGRPFHTTSSARRRSPPQSIDTIPDTTPSRAGNRVSSDRGRNGTDNKEGPFWSETASRTEGIGEHKQPRRSTHRIKGAHLPHRHEVVGMPTPIHQFRLRSCCRPILLWHVNLP